jgi:hypothetical protein
MESEPNSNLYLKYVRAIEFANEQVNEVCETEQQRSIFLIHPLSEHEFENWWRLVSEDHNCAARWHERLANPALAFNRLHQQINWNLSEIQIRRTAA